MSILKKVFGESIIYGLSSYVGVLASIFLTPIYTRILSKADYGLMDIYMTWNNLFMTILPFGLIGGLFRFYPEYKERIKSLTGTILVFLLIVGAIYGITMFAMHKAIITNIFNNDTDKELYLINIFIVIGSMFFSFTMTILRCEFKKINFLILSLMNISLLVSLGFIFVYFERMGVLGFFRASLITMILLNVTGFYMIRKSISISWDIIVFKNLFNYSIHILGVNILFQLVTFLDRKIILNYCSIDDLGLYAIGAKISSFLNLIFSALLLGWFPRAMSMKDNPNIKNIITSFHDILCLVLFPIIFVFFIFNKELIQFFAPDYGESVFVILFLSLSIIFIGFNNLFYNTGLHIMSKTKYITFASIISLITNVVISLLFVKKYGINGVAFGTFAGSIIWLVIQYTYNKIQYKISFNIMKPLIYIFILFVTFVCVNILNIHIYLFNEDYFIIFKLVISLSLILFVIRSVVKYIRMNKTNFEFL